MGNKIVELLSKLTTTKLEIDKDILILQFKVVNVFIIGDPTKEEDWVLVDTGLENSMNFIIKSASERFKNKKTPKAIILTHGHFDHVGSLIKLINKWHIPVYIHELEIPYVTGKKDYPLADPKVDNGIIAKMSPTFPHSSINIEGNIRPLPKDGSIPELPEWKWILTPGHSEGHISLYRERDRTLIVGDAFCSLKQESLLSVITQKKDISGPPKYLTTKWKEAEKSVKLLQSLEPKLILPSHGKPLKGYEAKEYLNTLVNHFKDIAVPEEGKFVD